MGGKKKHHQDKRERDAQGEEQPRETEEKVEEPEQTKEVKQFQAIAPKKVSYCPGRILTFELCKYGKDPTQCAVFLYKLAPTKVNKYHPDFKPEQVDMTKFTKNVEKGKEKAKEQQKSKTIKDKYVVIDVKNRGRKNYTTTVSGLNNFAIDCKQLAKKCSKKFAVSCSVTDQGTVQLQGDNFETMRDLLLAQYKQLKKKYILDKDQFNEKNTQEIAKKKQAKKLEKKTIQEVDEEQEQEEDKKEPPVKDVNQLRQELIEQTMNAADSDDD